MQEFDSDFEEDIFFSVKPLLFLHHEDRILDDYRFYASKEEIERFNMALAVIDSPFFIGNATFVGSGFYKAHDTTRAMIEEMLADIITEDVEIAIWRFEQFFNIKKHNKGEAINETW